MCGAVWNGNVWCSMEWERVCVVWNGNWNGSCKFHSIQTIHVAKRNQLTSLPGSSLRLNNQHVAIEEIARNNYLGKRMLHKVHPTLQSGSVVTYYAD